MFGIGFGELLVIGVFALLAVGPDRLPTMIKTVAKTYRQLRRTAEELRASTGIDELLHDEELRELAALRNKKLGGLGAPSKKSTTVVEKGHAAATTGAAWLRVEEFPEEGIDVREARLALAKGAALGGDPDKQGA